jgi:hypothetical protein
MKASAFITAIAQQHNDRLLGEILDLLVRLQDYMDDHSDTDDGDYGIPVPNREMIFSRDIEAAIETLELLHKTK